MTRILTDREIASLLTLDDCIDAVESVFRSYGEGRIGPSHSLGVHAGEGTIHIKAATAGVFAVKINANFPSNPSRHGLPTIQGIIAVFDIERGTPLAILDSGLITTLRTAAATAVAAKYLARRDSKTAAFIGFGNQGRANLEALTRVLPLERAVIFDPQTSGAPVSSPAHIDIASSIDEAVAHADVIVTSTPSREPLLHAHHARPGLFIAAVGADNPQKIEIAPELLARCRVVPDVLEQAATMGDLHHAIAAGFMSRESVHGELAAVICGRVPGRRTDEEMFVFDSTGTAIQDVVVAELALTSAGSPPTPQSERAGATSRRR